MVNETRSILYIYVQDRSFVRTDLDQLSKQMSVKPYHFKVAKKWMTPLIILKQFMYLILHGWKYTHFISFFAGYHSLAPVLFARLTGKKCFIILGGTDCFKYPSFRYGNFTKPLYGFATCVSASFASLLIPVSANLIKTRSPYYDADSIDQGIYHWCSDINTPFEVVPTEYNHQLFKYDGSPRRPNSFITVGFDIKGTSFIRKGIDKVIMIAQELPDCEITIVGCDEKDFPVPIPSNVKLIPPQPHAEVPKWMSQHQFYLQLSIAEGLPNALCEAMLCECIPIGSAVAAIPEAISTNGFLVSKRDDAVILETIRNAMATPDKKTMGQNARQHIMTQYGPGRRISTLVSLIEST